MRYIAIDHPTGPLMARVEGAQAVPLCPPEAFYADLPRWSARDAQAGHAPVPLAGAPLLPPAWAGARVLCVGLNYRAHAEEGGNPIPERPTIFARYTRSLVADGGEVPAVDPKLDWECELAVVIGRRLARVDEGEALAGVFGYAPFNDLSARAWQRHTTQWTPGKNMDRSGALGAITTADEVGDPARGLRLQSRLNGRVMQDSTTADMIFPVGRIIAYLCGIMTLHPGDLIATGTPSGVGYARKPPVYLAPGDLIEVEVEKLGIVRNTIVPGERWAHSA